MKTISLLEYAKCFDCCTFDFDGTLVDSNGIKHTCCAQALIESGFAKRKAFEIADRFILEERYYDLEVISKNPLKSST